jgi:hypothetical protein
MTAPEPWRDVPAAPIPTRRPRDPAETTGESELSWGPGLVPPKYNGRPPSGGGQYMPKCPPVELAVGAVQPREKRIPRDAIKGYPVK